MYCWIRLELRFCLDQQSFANSFIANYQFCRVFHSHQLLLFCVDLNELNDFSALDLICY